MGKEPGTTDGKKTLEWKSVKEIGKKTTTWGSREGVESITLIVALLVPSRL